MTFLEQCASRGLQREGYSKEDAKVFIQYLYPASTMEIIQSKSKRHVHGRFDAKKLFK